MSAFAAAGLVVASATIGATLGLATVTAAGTITCAATVAGAMEVGRRKDAAGTVACAATVAAVLRMAQVGGGRVDALATVAASLSKNFAARGNIIASCPVDATMSVDGQGLLVRDVVASAYSLLQGGCGCALPDDTCLQDALMLQINACLQTIYSRGDRLGYFNRSAVTLTFTGGSNSKAFEKNIQGVHGAVRLSTGNIPLREITDRMSFEQATDLYFGTAPAAPRAYHLLSAHEAAGDNVALTLLITPTPAASTDVKVDVILEAPRYAWSDVHAGTPLQLPHRYAESLLIPLVRDWATSHEHFIEKDLLQSIKQQADIARQTLGLINPTKPKGPREAAVPS